jgi:hypothetical protein
MGQGLSMNQLIDYLMGRLGKRTCPIVAIYKVVDTGFNSPWKEFYEIEFKDGSVIQFIEKPK